MVSLQSGFTTNSPARYFTEASSTSPPAAAAASEPVSSNDTGFISNMDDEPILSAESGNQFKPLRTVPAFSVHLLISAMISLAGVIMAAAWPDEKRCEAYFIMLYMRGIFWVITFLFDHYVKHQHEALRLSGYLQFHRATAVHRSLPLLVVTVWTVTFAGIQTLMQQYYGDRFAEHCVERWLAPVVYVTLFSSTETVVLWLVHGLYIARVRRFNTSQPLPDAMHGHEVQNIGSVGQSEFNANQRQIELIEKQADLINYLRDRNRILDQKLMQVVTAMHNRAMQN